MKNRIFPLVLLSFIFFQLTAQKKNINPASESSYSKGKIGSLKDNFSNPPSFARPGVYWYFMDGNLSREAMTADLESMKEAGIGKVLFLEVNVGIPRGKVDFLSEEWQELFTHAVRESERLGIEITLGIGPGWSGSGGPWVKPEESMQHLVASSVVANGPGNQKLNLPKPDPRKPYFGENVLTKELMGQWMSWYEDVAVLAFPTPDSVPKIPDIDEKALYYRPPFSSAPKVKPYLPMPGIFPENSANGVIHKDKIINLTSLLQPDGSLEWDVPRGKWTVMRFGKRNNGAITRPAPVPGLGFECDKTDTVALNRHFDQYVGKLIKKTGKNTNKSDSGWTMLHMDSWEMGAQNWGSDFMEEFQRRRGYDPLPFFPVYTGVIVENSEMSERFLWDLRQTAGELVIANHAEHLKQLCRRYGFGLSIEPYDMTPCADLDLGAVADVPMCEFWSKGYGFNTSFSCFEATSIADISGLPVVAAEAFTAGSSEAWKLYPGALKNQGDWAFCTGINRFFYHTFAHKPLGDQYRPGMTMGPYGVHWDRGQTWWPMASAYHQYVTRCSFMLQQGKKVADILYLTPEGAPFVFLPPKSALEGNDTIPDRKGFNFDGCSPGMLMSKASVADHQIVFPGGASYRLMVLPAFETMTPALLEKIESLIRSGAVVVGNPPQKSPSLVNYPLCDSQVRTLSEKIWGKLNIPEIETERKYGRGEIYWGGEYSRHDSAEIYPGYQITASLLKHQGAGEDFKTTGPVRYTHRGTSDLEIYFVSNKTGQFIQPECSFHIRKGVPELWDPVTGETRILPDFRQTGGYTNIGLQFEAFQSFFIVFDKNRNTVSKKISNRKNFPQKTPALTIGGPWSVSFDPEWGGPGKVNFDELDDWIIRPEESIKYYSGIATYTSSFNLPEKEISNRKTKLLLDLGDVKNLARVKLNGKDMGILWIAPWQVEITNSVHPGNNNLEIEVANLWPNRLIGDEQCPDDGIKNNQWPEWLTKGEPRTSGRTTFTTAKLYKKDAPLLKSGLLGPVKILIEMN